MTEQIRNASDMTSAEVREQLVNTLKLDLVGPWANHEFADEKIPGWERPSSWYLTGFLIPSGTPPEQRSDIDESDDMGVIPESAGLAEESTEERKAAKKGYFPSSMGLSFLVSGKTEEIRVTVRWGDYRFIEADENGKDSVPVWQRIPREETVNVKLQGAIEQPAIDVPESAGLQLHVVEKPVSSSKLHGLIPSGTRSVSIFIVNRRESRKERTDLAFAFQTEIEATANQPFVPRPDLRSAQARDWDDCVSDLHYADTPEYATGHGVSAEWEIVNGSCNLIRTSWIPSAQVEKTDTVDLPGAELSMEILGNLADGFAAEKALQPIVTQYRAWIEKQRSSLNTHQGNQLKTAEQLLHFAGISADRMEKGISLLSNDKDSLDAFRMANRAVCKALSRRLGIENPKWRAFQIAFILLNLPGLENPLDASRQLVDLLFFPTGGGKTEAYLGLAAFTMVLRRLKHSDDGGLAGAGVSVIMRYTLRLLTLDQLSRAAGLVCALEMEREKDTSRYGEWRFEIGLWVGKAATPNFLGEKGDKRQDSARAKVRAFKGNPRGKPSPIPLENCPWCGTRFEPTSFNLLPTEDHPRELQITCSTFECDFTRNRPLPIVAVDEQIYRRLPAFLISTVDKFASLPWTGQTGVLLGAADRYDNSGFYGSAEPGKGTPLANPLPPPDLVIQDELHLISGPLGTMVGLYETAIESLCVREIGGRSVGPKIVASTATVRRAQDQIQALFARPLTQVFPPQGPNRRDSFFAKTVPPSEQAARLYLGVTAQGRNPKESMRRVMLAVMASAERMYQDAGGNQNQQNPVDPYMTVLGYFNSLRELGGARRVIEEQVQNTLKKYGGRIRIGAQQGIFNNRKSFSQVVELTSRVSTNEVAAVRRRLESPFHRTNERVDCAIATNMISVGLDISRLGLMIVSGQPKTHAEYIQATSRVGRDDQRPGLVITLLNVHKPRDRSHYERFRHYHETFYRSVEVSSATPFSARALDRGLAGALVGLARHCIPELTPSRGAGKVGETRRILEKKLLDSFLERVRKLPFTDEEERTERISSVQNRVTDLLDSWQKVVIDYNDAGVEVKYQKYEAGQAQPLLRDILDQDFESEHHKKFRANRSLRDVEPQVNLFLRNLSDNRVENDDE